VIHKDHAHRNSDVRLDHRQHAILRPDYAKKSPAEKIRDALLQSVGVTEDELKNMTPEQRKDVEQKIADKIKEAMQKQTEKGESPKGFFTDITA
jgi:TPP-dependent pyruvate/acetoin dehydrogenase alpha subunit